MTDITAVTPYLAGAADAELEDWDRLRRPQAMPGT